MKRPLCLDIKATMQSYSTPHANVLKVTMAFQGQPIGRCVRPISAGGSNRHDVLSSAFDHVS